MMKIEVDLKDIFTDEDGNVNETMEEAIKRQVVECLVARSGKGLGKTIDREVTSAINTLIKEATTGKMEGIIEDLLCAEYEIVHRFGDRGKLTTFRKELVSTIVSSLEYKPTTFPSDKNAFTKAVDSVVEVQMKKFQSEFNAIVTDKFTKDALTYATTELKKRLK